MPSFSYIYSQKLDLIELRLIEKNEGHDMHVNVVKQTTPGHFFLLIVPRKFKSRTW